MTTVTGSTPVDLTGQVALVTGAGRGLGRAFALALGQAGASVAVTARTVAALAETVQMVERSGGRALAIPGDVAEPDAVANVVSTAESQLGPLDILVNNAGVTGPVGDDWNVDPEDWWRTFAVNMRGPFLCSRAVLAGMITRRRGRIVNISSGAASNCLPQMAVYCATKAALTQWTHCLARETKAYGVVVLAFAPGFVRTPMTEELTGSSDVPTETGNFFRAFLNEGRDTPIARSVERLLFLISGQADALSGCFIHVKEDEEALRCRVEKIRRDNPNLGS